MSNRQDSIFCACDPMDKNHKDPEVIDLSEPRRAQYLHKAWKRHQDAVFLGRHQSCYEERIDILSDSIGCSYPSRNTSSLMVFRKVVRMETGEVKYENVYMSPQASIKDLLETRMEKRIGFRTCSTSRSWATIKKVPIEPTTSKSK